MNQITAADLRAAIDYSPATGHFTWRRRGDMTKRWNSRWAGKQAGTECEGYIRIRINSVQYLAARLAWLHFHGRWPLPWIDHKNGNGTDNRIANLRECTATENHQNRARQSNNKSGLVGVSRRAKGGWCAMIHHRYKQIYLGTFATKKSAHDAYLVAKRSLHTFHPDQVLR